MKLDSYSVILGNKILYFETSAVDLASVKHRFRETSVPFLCFGKHCVPGKFGKISFDDSVLKRYATRLTQ
jgi:hypothetical protein